jgi:membrane-bound lytic murein transglycosylase F
LKSSSQLGSKDVYIPKGSVFDARLKQLSDEIGENINRRYFANDPSTEDLIEMVSSGKIKFTVSNQNLALICAQKYANLSTNTLISAEQKIAFGIRKNNPKLKQKLNGFLKNYCSSSIFLALKDRYFNSAEPEPVNQILLTKNGNLSPYDDLFKAAASTYGWDWKILASLCFQESNFNPSARGLGGAFGLMQFMPNTGANFGVYPNSSPEVQINGAMKMLNTIYNSWSSIPDIEQRIKFTLASYNAGKGHIDDGQRLALKHGFNHQIWDGNVQVMVKKLADPMFYRESVVKCGAYRGPASGYVTEVYQRYLSWK